MKKTLQSICQRLTDWLIDPDLKSLGCPKPEPQYVELGRHIAWRTVDGEWDVREERNGFHTGRSLFLGDLAEARRLFK